MTSSHLSVAFRTCVPLFFLSLCTTLELPGAEYFLNPVHGSAQNSGTRDQPWDSLETVCKAKKKIAAGDILTLESGFHGSPVLRGTNADWVTIRSAPGAHPTLKRLTVRAARRWRIEGLEISPSATQPYQRVPMLTVSRDCSEIQVENCRLYSIDDAAQWSAHDWDTLSCNGILVSGQNCLVQSNVLRNVNFGISSDGPSNVVSWNVVENFSGDGLRGLADYDIFEHNLVENCYDVNDNHDDGFQSWTTGKNGVGSGVIKGIVLRGNRIINYIDPNQPFRGTLQGIGCFDGFFEDWVIENNEILVDHWHGITLGGARNCRIINNTVVDLNDHSPGPPWIMIGRHKNGSPSSGNLVRNNLATAYSIQAGSAVEDHNGKVREYEKYFRAYPKDLRLKNGSPAIDAGSNDSAPVIDISGNKRPLDGDGDGKAACDLGAHEYDPR